MSIPGSLSYPKHPKFYFEYVYIQVEDELFKLPRYKFEEESETFRLLSPRPREKFGASWVPEKPFLYLGFSKAEFVVFLRFFYPRGLCAALAKSEPEGTKCLESALKVATVMHLPFTRQSIISRLLIELRSDPSAKLLLGMKYWASELIEAASSSLVHRTRRMSNEEISSTGFEIALHISQAREARMTNADWKAQLLANLEGQRSKCEIISPVPEVPESLAIRYNNTYHVEEFIFLVKNELFNIPSYPFLNDSQIFSDMFSIPCSNSSVEGKNDCSPIVLEGVSDHDFALLMEALYIPMSERTKSSWKQLACVLKLSTMWRFQAIRTEAIAQLDTHFQSDNALSIHQLILGQSQKVPQWIVDGYHHLANRPDPLTAEDRGLLTPTTIWTVIELRDTYQQSSCRCIYHAQVHYLRRQCTKAEVKQKVLEELKTATFA